MQPTHPPAPDPTAILTVIGIAFLLWLLFSYCLKRICEKCGTEPGFLIWLPILNIIPMLRAADLSPWWLFLFFIPLANFIFGLMVWARICEARGKSKWLVLLIFVPLLNILFIPYLAF
ncbi:MAG TPA: DUF5684 domain-containing protein, partial [Verrucomicrobiae bacterium]|nr:DUF5684 domain-containing protein [Verrucomicrobiae bacterium]